MAIVSNKLKLSKLILNNSCDQSCQKSFAVISYFLVKVKILFIILFLFNLSLLFAEEILANSSNNLGNSLSKNSGKRVSLIIEDASPDATWYNHLEAGLMKAKQAFDLEVEIVEAKDSKEQVAIFRKVATNSDLVIVAEPSLHAVLRDNAANFRKIKFGCLDTGIRAANIMSINFADELAAYWSGVAMAMLAKKETTALGWLSGVDSPMDNSMYQAWLEGVRSVRPDLRGIRQIAGSFADAKANLDKAKLLLEANVESIVLRNRRGALAVLPLLKEKHIAFVAEDSSIAKMAPDLCLTTIYKDIEGAIFDLCASFAIGEFAAKKILSRNFKNKGVNVEPLQTWAKNSQQKIPTKIEKHLAEIYAKLAHGKIPVVSRRIPTLCDC